MTRTVEVDSADDQRRLLERLRVLRERQRAKATVEQRRWRAYADDPVGWIADRVRGELWSGQATILEAIRDDPRVVVPACHGAGKSYIAAAAAAWWIDVHPPGEAFVLSTAPTGPQVRAILWRELARIHRRGGLPGRILGGAEWKLDDGELVAMGRKPADSNQHGFQGIHAPAVLVVLDEACGVPAQLWQAAQSIATTAGSRILAIGNPDDPSSEMARRSAPASGWRTITVDAFDLPTITADTLEAAADRIGVDDRLAAAILDEYRRSPAAERAGEELSPYLSEQLTSPDWVVEAARDWGIGTPLWDAKVRGEWPETTDDAIIPLAWIRRAQERRLDAADGDPSILGVDVARYGRDSTVIYHRHGPRLRRVAADDSTSTVEVAGMTRRALDDTGATSATVDVGGVGGGVVDTLEAERLPVAGVDFGGKPRDRERFYDRRAELYWALRQRLEPDEDGHADADLDPADDQLAAELSTLHYSYDSRARVRIESKERMRRRGVPSPDHADAAVLTEAGELGRADGGRRARAGGTAARSSPRSSRGRGRRS